MNGPSVIRVNPRIHPSAHHPNTIGNAFPTTERISRGGENPANSRCRPNCGCVGTRVRITNQRKCHRLCALACVYTHTHTPSSPAVPPKRCGHTNTGHVQLNVAHPLHRVNERRIRSTVQTPRLVHPAAILLPLRHRRIIIRLCSSIRPDRGHLRERGIGEMILIFKSEMKGGDRSID